MDAFTRYADATARTAERLRDPTKRRRGGEVLSGGLDVVTRALRGLAAVSRRIARLPDPYRKVVGALAIVALVVLLLSLASFVVDTLWYVGTHLEEIGVGLGLVVLVLVVLALLPVVLLFVFAEPLMHLTGAAKKVAEMLYGKDRDDL